MSTPRNLIKSTWGRWKDLVTFHGELEDYVLFAAAKIVSFGLGVGLGYWLWGT